MTRLPAMTLATPAFVSVRLRSIHADHACSAAGLFGLVPAKTSG